MKIGDIIRSTKVRPNDTAKVIKADVKQRYNDKKKKTEIRTEYVAEFEDKTTMTFYGFDIDRSIFRIEESDGQMRLEEFMDI